MAESEPKSPRKARSKAKTKPLKEGAATRETAKKPTAESSGQDSVWKELLDKFLPEFLQFFFPTVYAEIDWQYPPKSLNTEMQKIIRKGERGKSLADVLVEVVLLTGEVKGLIIHVEVQGYADQNFAERMYYYYSRAKECYKKPVESLAILTDPAATDVSLIFEEKRKHTALTFTFGVVKVWEYAKKLEELEATNPFAIVALAHVRNLAETTPKGKIAAKIAVARSLFARGFNSDVVWELIRFIDWLILVPNELQDEFDEALGEEEKRLRMTFKTSIERKAEALGEARGREEGRETALHANLMLVRIKFGAVETDVEQKLNNLSLGSLRQLTDAILGMSSVSDLAQWLEQNG